MVWQQALYLVNLLCKFVPCDYTFPLPDTSLSEPQAFKNLISLGFEDGDGPLGSLKIGHSPGWGPPMELDYTKSDPLVVVTRTGKLRGYWMKVVGGRGIRAFEGIPYAEPPVGYFRFSAPAPKVPWSGLRWARKKGPKCLQFSQIELKTRIVGSEDCLCLNVYAPPVSKPLPNKGPGGGVAERFPVVVFIHGGGWQIGSGGDYGPSYLLQQDIILVTFNYRLGLFGFLSTGDESSPGNYGLKDQALAIQWVAENIEFFNGDPGRITLLGQEAGGASVHFQMLSPRARPFFQAGVAMSGTAFSPWALGPTEAASDLTKRFAKKAGCPSHTPEAILSCMRRVDPGDLTRLQIKFLEELPIPLYLFRPVLEDQGQRKEPPFLSDPPEDIYRKNLVSPIPFIAGFTEDEGLTFLLPSVFRGSIKKLRAHWTTLAPDFLDYAHLPRGVEEVTKKVNWLYFKQSTPQTASIKTFSDALSLRMTVAGVHKALQAHSSLAPTYGYMFAYNGKYNLATLAGIKPHEWGVGQGEDIFYLLNSTHLYQGFAKSDHEMILSKIMVNLFGNFAAKRVPSFLLETKEDFPVWAPITDPRNMSFLLIHKKIKMIPEPYVKQSVYWESIGLPDTTPYVNLSDHYKDHHFILGNTRGQVVPDEHSYSSIPLFPRGTPHPNDGYYVSSSSNDEGQQGGAILSSDNVKRDNGDKVSNSVWGKVRQDAEKPELQLDDGLFESEEMSSPKSKDEEEDSIFLPPWKPAFIPFSPSDSEETNEVDIDLRTTPLTKSNEGGNDLSYNHFIIPITTTTPPPPTTEEEEEEDVFIPTPGPTSTTTTTTPMPTEEPTTTTTSTEPTVRYSLETTSSEPTLRNSLDLLDYPDVVLADLPLEHRDIVEENVLDNEPPQEDPVVISTTTTTTLPPTSTTAATTSILPETFPTTTTTFPPSQEVGGANPGNPANNNIIRLQRLEEEEVVELPEKQAEEAVEVEAVKDCSQDNKTSEVERSQQKDVNNNYDGPSPSLVGGYISNTPDASPPPPPPLPPLIIPTPSVRHLPAFVPRQISDSEPYIIMKK